VPRFVIDLEFDGRAFSGTQSQATGRTLQALVAQTLGAIDGAAPQVRPASRLDAGVSAEHLPCDALLARDWDPAALCAALNARLPQDVAALRAARVDETWQAQHRAQAKTYRYELVLRPSRPVLDARATWVRQLDHPELLPLMAAQLPGRRDLSGFSTLRRDDSDDDDPVREIDLAEWTRESRPLGDYLVFRVRGAGFLYRQVRGLVGAMIYVAKGRRPLDAFAEAVSRGRAAERLGNIAPAHGLVLERVAFDPEPDWRSP
jgi:tRNA pseudouridine38-40 synthase